MMDDESASASRNLDDVEAADGVKNEAAGSPEDKEPDGMGQEEKSSAESVSGRGAAVRRRVASALYFAFAAGVICTGLAYAAAPGCMPYHSQIAGIPWEEFPERQKLLHLAFQHGAGMMAAAFGALFAAVNAFAFRRGERWAEIALPASGLTAGIPLLDIVLQLSRASSARTPVVPLAIGVFMLLAGALLTLPKRRARHFEAEEQPESDAVGQAKEDTADSE